MENDEKQVMNVKTLANLKLALLRKKLKVAKTAVVSHGDLGSDKRTIDKNYLQLHTSEVSEY